MPLVDTPRVELLSWTGTPERVVASAAKLCYSRTPPEDIYASLADYEDVKMFLDRLSNFGHQSPVEHASFTFMISGVSRSFLAQITRHRIASFSVQSQRYCNMDDFDYVLPVTIRKNQAATEEAEEVMHTIADGYHTIHDLIVLDIMEQYTREHLNELWEKALKIPGDDPRVHSKSTDESEIVIRLSDMLVLMQKHVLIADDVGRGLLASNIDDDNVHYVNYMELGSARQIEALHLLFKDSPDWIVAYTKAIKSANEDARCVLPNACCTSMVVTMNARELLHFFELRCCNRAQKEIRDVAWLMLRRVQEQAPTIFANAGPACLSQGKCSEGAMTCGKPYSISKEES